MRNFGSGDAGGFVETDSESAAAFGGAELTTVVDEEATHVAGCGGAEMIGVLPAGGSCGSEAEPCFVNQRFGLKEMAGALVGREATGGDPKV